MRRLLPLLTAAALLAGCSSLPSWVPFTGPDKPKPAELKPNPNLIGVREAWTARIGRVDFPLVIGVGGTTAMVANSEGAVIALDVDTGRELWRASAGGPIAAGVGTDGTTAAVVTRSNELVAFSAGRELWRQKLNALSYTPPLVAGARVFVLGGDRAISAYDGATGRRLWSQQRQGEPLVLREPGVLLAVRDTLVVGQGGRLSGLNPLNGTARWDAAIATARGINDVERLVDLVGRVSRVDDSVCARAFQAAVGCVDTITGRTAWTQRANGSQGIHGDAAAVFGTESTGIVVGWRRDNGQRTWANDTLLHRGVGTPLALGRSVVVHLLAREDGTLLNRLATDGSAIVAAPTAAGNTLLVVTRNGGIYGFAPQ
jgi:outer membrane protein assembly factor BamB